MKKTALVLEGGAMRGLYSAAVLDVLMDEGIKVDAIYATSAGVLFGVNYLSGQRGRAIRYNKRFARDKRYMGIHSLVTSGNIINKDFAFYEVPFTLDVFDQEAYSRSETKMIATVTNVHTGGVEYIEVKDKMFADYEDREKWKRMMLVIVAKAGFFSSDRTIAEYNRDIWKL